MILKSYETKKINININKIVLFYGQNEGYKDGSYQKVDEAGLEDNQIHVLGQTQT